MIFTVTKLFDGNTFEVSPHWKWNNRRGNIVRVNGYDAPVEGGAGYQAPRNKLERLILNKEVELRDPVETEYDQLLCDVYYEGKNIGDYFPECQ